MQIWLWRRTEEENVSKTSSSPESPPSPPPPPPPPSGASGASGTKGSLTLLKLLLIPTSWLFLSSGESVILDTAAPSSSQDRCISRITCGATNKLRQSLVGKPLTEDRPATPEPAWTIPSFDLSMPTNNWAFAMKSTYAPPQEKISTLLQTRGLWTTCYGTGFCYQRGILNLLLRTWKALHSKLIKGYNVNRPLPLGGKPGHVTIQPDFFFNKDLEYLRYGRKVGRPALPISKMKAAYYLMSVGTTGVIRLRIAEECKYGHCSLCISYIQWDRLRGSGLNHEVHMKIHKFSDGHLYKQIDEAFGLFESRAEDLPKGQSTSLCMKSIGPLQPLHPLKTKNAIEVRAWRIHQKVLAGHLSDNDALFLTQCDN
ncbi:hypothetical protein Tco_0774530 [Tanacetum coccineum]|uniref:Uncharacterized protein n=1 Tax=Tanacetum coccineum TaxID=301880 RepID=A0ABQ4ZNQ8_9ASTR